MEPGGVVLILLLAAYIVGHLTWQMIRDAVQRRRDRQTRERKRAQADAAPYNFAARSSCLLCGDQGNLPQHGCHYYAQTGTRSYKRTGRRHDGFGRPIPPYYERETGLIYKTGATRRAYQRCYHGHVHELDALYCARTMLRRLQVGERPSTVPGLTDARWRSIVRNADYRCHYCNGQFTLRDLHKEHKTPLSRGGLNTIDNIVPSCGPCNYRKGRKTAQEFLEPAEKRSRSKSERPRRRQGRSTRRSFARKDPSKSTSPPAGGFTSPGPAIYPASQARSEPSGKICHSCDAPISPEGLCACS